jgi:hypothetical protein
MPYGEVMSEYETPQPFITDFDSLTDILCFLANLQPLNFSISTDTANPFFCVFVIY